jgi:N-acetylglucosaminyldiphosphoundecaprenol N-acetyl-beta-D-mannosaminyltransferase
MTMAIKLPSRAPTRRAARHRSADDSPVVYLRGVPLSAISEPQCVAAMMQELDAGRGGWAITPNLEILRQAVADPAKMRLVRRAKILLADGMTLVWASRIQGTPLPQRVCGSNLIHSLSEAAATRGRSVFLLGGAGNTADRAAKALVDRYPQLKVAGTYTPPFGFENDPHEMQRIIHAVDTAQPDIVYVALGFPKAERLIEKIRCVQPRAWWIGVGISFSFLCGDVRRAPCWMQRIGLEWFHRLLQEPRRLSKRYLVHGIPFAFSLLLSSSYQRIARQARGASNRRAWTTPYDRPQTQPWAWRV